MMLPASAFHVLLSTFTWSSFYRRFRPSDIKLSSTSPDDSLALTHRTFISATTKKSSWLKSSIAIKEVVATPRFSSSVHNGNNVISHDGIPIGAVQLGSKHIQKFSNLINETLTKTSKKSLSYRGVQPYIGPPNISDKEEGGNILLIHVPPIVATALDDDHPDLVNFLKQTNGVYLPGVRRSRMHRSATRRKRNANIKEEQSSTTAKPKSTITAATTSSLEPSFTFSELFAGIGGFRLGLEAM